jgi:wyosine [tRNA(Phe)-imidazoG37] synthetase (radical SAM superfamily)
MIIFGPVPSRRLGRSLGINNIPPKICSYNCVYCQIGRTPKMQMERKSYYNVEYITEEVINKVAELREKGERIDYITFVSDGEPTLDINIGIEIETIKALGFKIALITNSSLIWRDDVRSEILKADWISLKLDAGSEKVWHRINRPYKKLCYSEILNGMISFAKEYKGFLTTETMLVGGINDDESELKRIAEHLKRLKPQKAYISIPIRPPAEKNIIPPEEEKINTAYQIFNEEGITSECLIGYEGDDFSLTGNFEEDLLKIMAVHPMKEKAVKKLLQKCDCDSNIITKMLDEQKIVRVKYRDEIFYMRKLFLQENT